MNYENRYVLFLDILGFKKIVEGTFDKNGDIPNEIEKLYNALETISKSNNITSSSKRVTQFSDSIVVSFNDIEYFELVYLLDDISYMLYLLAFEGILCRGAIAYGKFFHDEKYLFGPALVEAYETESKAAMYPRVIVDKSVINIYKEKSKTVDKKSGIRKDFIDNNLKEDFDDKLYVDYFLNPLSFVDSKEFYINYLEKLREVISNGLSRARTADISVKYGWMKQKFNNTLTELQNNSTSFNFLTEELQRLKKIKHIN